MDSAIKLCRKNNGFSLVEVVIVMSIIGLLSYVSFSFFGDLKTSDNLKIATTTTVEAVRRAQSNAEVGKNDSDWGVKIMPGSVVIFKGSNYITRDEVFDQSIALSPGVTPSGVLEIVFAKITGETLNTGSITLSNSENSIDIFINEKGTITY